MFAIMGGAVRILDARTGQNVVDRLPCGPAIMQLSAIDTSLRVFNIGAIQVSRALVPIITCNHL